MTTQPNVAYAPSWTSNRHCLWPSNARPKKNGLHNLPNHHTGHYWDREGEGGNGGPFRCKALSKPVGAQGASDYVPCQELKQTEFAGSL